MLSPPRTGISADSPDGLTPVSRVVDRIVHEEGSEAEHLVPILQGIQRELGYLPEEALRRITEITRIPAAQVSGVASFYAHFRHKPVGKHIISVCHGTACHVKGAPQIEDAIRRHLNLGATEDTDSSGTFTLEQVACIGCCSLAPVMRVDGMTYGRLTTTAVPGALKDFLNLAKRGKAIGSRYQRSGKFVTPLTEFRISEDSCCVVSGSADVRAALEEAVAASKAPAVVRVVGCTGLCNEGPIVEVNGQEAGGRRQETAATDPEAGNGVTNTTPDTRRAAPFSPTTTYTHVTPDDSEAIVARHLRADGLRGMVRSAWRSGLDRLFTDEAWEPVSRHAADARDPLLCSFRDVQTRIATEFCGRLDPLDLAEYMAHGGFAALRDALDKMEPDTIIDVITKAGLRGRGGAGFPTGIKWSRVRSSISTNGMKYVICNGDEGDPGAFMDRMLLESFPYRVLEGMTIAAYAVGAQEGILYIRAEYPQAVQRIKEAIRRCTEAGILRETSPNPLLRKEGANGETSPNPLSNTGANGATASGAQGTDGFSSLIPHPPSLSLRVVQGGGAFVCGEETALIASIEGKRGEPRLRPPYPAESGLWGRPTSINNVETYALVPWILRHGPEAFAAMGTEKSKGTKVFSLAGNIKRGGLIEVKVGTTLREIVEEIGGGIPDGRTFKAVQMGGPSGGCVPASLAETPVDYESLVSAGAIMGSGGMVVLDDRTCMVDMARYFLQFTQNESCGKCTMCRLGTRRLLDILERLCRGEGRASDMDKLEDLAEAVGKGSLCGLGQTAPNPVLSTLRHFKDEYIAHIEGRCPAGKCKDLIHYRVEEGCIGCTLCAQECPVDAIALLPFQKHHIDDSLCTRCDACRVICPEKCITVT